MASRKSTGELENELKKIKDSSALCRWMEENGINDKNQKRFSNYFNQLCEAKGIRLAELTEKVALSRAYIYACADGTKTAPSKEAVIKLAIGLNANLEEINCLLKLSGNKELYARNEVDSIVIFGIENGYDVYAIDALIERRGLKMCLTDRE